MRKWIPECYVLGGKVRPPRTIFEAATVIIVQMSIDEIMSSSRSEKTETRRRRAGNS